jgi:hypothetical protein
MVGVALFDKKLSRIGNRYPVFAQRYPRGLVMLAPSDPWSRLVPYSVETSDPIHPDCSGRFESLRAALLMLPSLARFQLADREDIVQTALNAVNERYSDRGVSDQHALAKRIAINEAWERIRGERVVPHGGAPPQLDDLAETPGRGLESCRVG